MSDIFLPKTKIKLESLNYSDDNVIYMVNEIIKKLKNYKKPIEASVIFDKAFSKNVNYRFTKSQFKEFIYDIDPIKINRFSNLLSRVSVLDLIDSQKSDLNRIEEIFKKSSLSRPHVFRSIKKLYKTSESLEINSLPIGGQYGYKLKKRKE